jgi:peptidyl-prolyl cis-trans isomerase B (cyclophilin B)
MKKAAFLSLVYLILISCTMCTSKKKEDRKTETVRETAVMQEVAKETVVAPESGSETVLLMKTTLGDMKIKLYNETPQHRNNFIKLVNAKFYDGLLFHRVIKGFMIQGGDPDSKNAPPGKRLGMGDPGYTLPAEILPQFKHKKGALAAARTNNPERRSSGSQFYIVHDDVGAKSLDRAYTVFGEVIEGLNVVDKIATVKTLPGDRPEVDVKIISVTIVK